jgi:micrococcal nuclease
MTQNENLMTFAKVALIFFFFPLVLIWNFWQKENWSKTKKWALTLAVIFVALIFFAVSEENKAYEKNKEIEALERQVADLKQAAEQQQKSAEINLQNSQLREEAKIKATSGGAYDVASVTDGDTIKVRIIGKLETIRLIGIDTPETVDPRKPVQCFGKEASNQAMTIFKDKKVRLEVDPTQGDSDQYGRLLRYVFLEDGTFVNKKMIEDGFAHEYTFQSKPYKYQAEFKDAEKSAAASLRGLWAPQSCNGNTEKAATTQAASIEPAAPTTSQISSTESVSTTQAVSDGGVVKMSSTKICHAPGTSYYAKTKSFIPYDSIVACIAAGGRLPKR